MSNKFTATFPDLNTLFALEGEQVSYAKTRDVIKIKQNDETFYVKRYITPGKGLRRYFGRSRLRAEWENLEYFASLGIPVPELIAFAEQRDGLDKKGAMVLREIPDVVPLNEIGSHEIFQDPKWRRDVIKKIAEHLRILHKNRFTHGDFYLRNILVNMQGDVFFIDCPQGKKRIQPLLRHWRRKDLKCLHKEAKGLFSEEDIEYFLEIYRPLTEPER